MNPCPTCAWHNESSSRFCVSCGARLSEAPRAATNLQGQVPAPESRPRSSPANSRPNVHYGGAAARPLEPDSDGLPQSMREPQAAAHPTAPSPEPGSEGRGVGAPPPPFDGETARPSRQGASLEEYEREALARYAQNPAPARAEPAPAPGGSVAQRPEVAVAQSSPRFGTRLLVGFLASYEVLEVGQYWPLYEGRNLIGRQGATDEADIEIAHATTSSRHAAITASTRPGRALLEDLGSTNGTFVNDVPLPGGHQWELADGDRIRLGLFTAVVKII